MYLGSLEEGDGGKRKGGEAVIEFCYSFARRIRCEEEMGIETIEIQRDENAVTSNEG